jgi:hypothetical protein
MGRKKKAVQEVMILEMREQGRTLEEIAQGQSVSTATVSRRVAELQSQHGLLVKYRELQSLQLTELQYSVLEAITPEKIADASLLELIKCFHILEKAKQAIQGKSSLKITGLVGYLIELEKSQMHTRS